MKRVTGIGGIFFKSKDPAMMAEWYREHLGIEIDEHGAATFMWQDKGEPQREGMTVWSLFPHDTKYFGDGPAPFMVNYRVNDMDAIVAQLASEGVQIDERVEDAEYGRFRWLVDPEGNRIELWEPPAVKAENKS